MSASPMAPGSFDSSARLGAELAAPSGPRSLLVAVRAAAAGDQGAATSLYREMFGAVFSAAARASGRDEHFCLDVVQETFLRIIRSSAAAARIRDDAHAERWVLAVTHNVALDLLRAERRRAARDLAAGRSLVSQAETSEVVDERMAAIIRTLEQLAPEDRALLALRTSGMTLAGIAETLGATVGSVHGRLRRLTSWIASRHETHAGDRP